MISFSNDYSEGAHINIIKALTETNLEQTVGSVSYTHLTLPTIA